MVTSNLEELRSGPEPWTGREEDWAVFKFKMKNKVRKIHEDLPDMMDTAACQTVEVDLQTMSQVSQGLAGKLMSELSDKCKDRALRVLMSCPQPGNGFEGWRLLSKVGEGGGKTRKTGLLNAILKFEFGANKSTEEFLD